MLVESFSPTNIFFKNMHIHQHGVATPLTNIGTAETSIVMKQVIEPSYAKIVLLHL